MHHGRGANGATESVDRVHRLLKELRTKYAVERAELVGAVTEQVADVRSELETANSNARENSAALEALRKQLASMTTHHDGPADLLAATREAVDKLDTIRQAADKAAQEAAFLKSALAGDRIRREERRRQHEADDSEIEVRIRQIEEANAAARLELSTIKATNMETLQNVADMVHECKFDQPTISAVNDMRSLKDSVMADLDRVRSENAALVSRLNSIIDFSANEERRRSKNVATLEAAVREIESRPPSHVAPQAAPRVATGLFADQSFEAANESLTNRTTLVSRKDTANDGLVRTPRAEHSVTGTGTHGATSTMSSVRNDFRTRIAAFYAAYNSSKLSSLDAVLREYAGAEEELMSALEVHYGAFGYFSAH